MSVFLFVAVTDTKAHNGILGHSADDRIMDSLPLRNPAHCSQNVCRCITYRTLKVN